MQDFIVLKLKITFVQHADMFEDLLKPKLRLFRRVLDELAPRTALWYPRLEVEDVVVVAPLDELVEVFPEDFLFHLVVHRVVVAVLILLRGLLAVVLLHASVSSCPIGLQHLLVFFDDIAQQVIVFLEVGDYVGFLGATVDERTDEGEES